MPEAPAAPLLPPDTGRGVPPASGGDRMGDVEPGGEEEEEGAQLQPAARPANENTNAIRRVVRVIATSERQTGRASGDTPGTKKQERRA